MLPERLQPFIVELPDLITKIRRGDKGAFNELFGIHWKPLVDYASLIVGNDNAQDVVQSVFMKVWENRASLKDGNSMRQYLLKAVYHTSINFIRKEDNSIHYRSWFARRIDETLASEYDIDRNDVIKALYTKELSRDLETAMSLLPPKCQEVFRMSYIDCLSGKEISESLGISVSTVNNQIHKALKILRSNLCPYKALVYILMLYFLTRS